MFNPKTQDEQKRCNDEHNTHDDEQKRNNERNTKL